MAGEREVQIMDLGYRVAHLVNVILFLSLVVSGLMLFASDALSWFALAIGEPLSTLQGVEADPVVVGVQWARTWHRVVGVTWGAFLLVYAVYYVAFNRRFDVLRALAKGVGEQVREAAALMKHYLTGAPLPPDVRARLGRHNVLVGYLFILLLVSVILLSVSGVVLVYREQLGLTLEQARLMYLLHDVGFVLALAFLLLHLYATLHPENRPLLRAVFFDGKVPREWAEEHMPEAVKGGGE